LAASASIPADVITETNKARKALAAVKDYDPRADMVAQIVAAQSDPSKVSAILSEFDKYDHQREKDLAQANLDSLLNYNLETATASFVAAIAKPRSKTGDKASTMPVLMPHTFTVEWGDSTFDLEWKGPKDWRLRAASGKLVTSYAKCKVELSSWTAIGRVVRIAMGDFDGKAGDIPVKIQKGGFSAPLLSKINAGGTAVFSAYAKGQKPEEAQKPEEVQVK
jgi:hypothetical protein